ncbi:MAG: pyridoxamine 5'-phosphate oxidase, partial [Humidesulfovibrio sp.]|nr:pyridoxamine 5'-phosphate oxidase [Humidesulfovibrio sp.]
MVSIRLKGAANLDDNMEVKRRIMAENALVRSLYGSADHPDFTVFSVDHGSAFLFDFSGDPPKSVEF